MPPTLPSLPRLKGHVEIAPVRDDYLILHGPNLFLKITEDGVPLLRRVLPLLDGQRSVAEVASEAGVALREAEEVLAPLAENGLLEDGRDDPAPAGVEAAAAQRAFLSHVTDRPNAALARLASSEALLVGAGPVGAAAAAALVEAGVGRLRVLDPTSAPQGGTRAEALAAALGAGARVGVERSAAPDLASTRAADVAEAARGSAHVLVALEAPDAPLLRTVNDAALAEGLSWTPAVLEGPRAVVGPTVVPRRGACWRCFELRRLGAEPHIDQELVLWDARDRTRGRAPGAPASHAAIAGGWLAQETVLVLSGILPSPLLGRVLVVDLLRALSARHRVLRLPRCPACGSASIPDVDRFDLEPVVL